jgi:membrane-associated phospholipid phosphatase
MSTLLPPAVIAFALPVVLFLTFWALCYRPLRGLVHVVKTGIKGASARLLNSRMGKWSFGHSGTVGSYAPMLLVVAVGGAAALGAGYLFVVLSEQITVITSAVYHTDQAVHTWFGNERQPAITTLFTAATNLGSTIGLGAIVAVAGGTLLARKERASAVFIVVTAAVGALLNLGLKLIFARARPDLASAIAVARWYSFPSGHAMDSFIAFGALGYVELRQPWPWVAKSAGLALALTTMVLIGVSRVYLGVHWASDIAAGWSAGTVWVASAVVAFEMVLHLRARRRGAAPASPAVDVPDKPVPARPSTT